jgi:hypothetical protein
MFAVSSQDGIGQYACRCGFQRAHDGLTGSGRHGAKNQDDRSGEHQCEWSEHPDQQVTEHVVAEVLGVRRLEREDEQCDTGDEAYCAPVIPATWFAATCHRENAITQCDASEDAYRQQGAERQSGIVVPFHAVGENGHDVSMPRSGPAPVYNDWALRWSSQPPTTKTTPRTKKPMSQSVWCSPVRT